MIFGVEDALCPSRDRTFTFDLTAEPGFYALQLFEATHGTARGGIDTTSGPGTEPEAGALLLSNDEGLQLTELTLAADVVDRQAVDPRHTFSKASDQRVYCLVRLDNEDRVETEIFMGWERVGRPPPDDPGREMTVRAGPRYVTWLYRGTRQPPGRYRCVVRDLGGELLGQVAYELTE